MSLSQTFELNSSSKVEKWYYVDWKLTWKDLWNAENFWLEIKEIIKFFKQYWIDWLKVLEKLNKEKVYKILSYWNLDMKDLILLDSRWIDLKTIKVYDRVKDILLRKVMIKTI